jgi:hypothetical protein
VPDDLETSFDHGPDLPHGERRVMFQMGQGQAADVQIAKTESLNLRCEAETKVWNADLGVSIEHIEKCSLTVFDIDPALVVQEFGQAEGCQRHEISTSLEPTAGCGREECGIGSSDDETQAGVKTDFERIKDRLGLLDLIHEDDGRALDRRTNVIEQEQGIGGDSIPEANIVARKRKDGGVRRHALEEVLDDRRFSTPDDAREDQGSGC